MANPVATVAFIDGQAWAKAPDGTLRVLAQGDVLNADELLITAEGARVELDFGEGPAVAIAGGQEVGMGPDLWEVTVTDPSDAALADASVQQALTILDEGGDLFEELEAPAAGGGDSSGGGGNSFVQIGRNGLEEFAEQQFDYGSISRTTSTGTLDGLSLPNGAPVSSELTFDLDEDSEISGRFPALDPENDILSFTLITQPLNGSVTLDSATGEFVYQPVANYFGTDSFVVTITDPRGNTTTSTVSLNVIPVNEAPTTSDLNLQTNEEVPVAGQVVAEDIEGDNLTYLISDAPIHGTVVIDSATGEFIYTPGSDYFGSDTFIVTLSDGKGGITISTVTVNVLPVNDAPVTTDINLVTNEDTPVSGQVVGTDVENDSLTYTVTTPPGSGSISLDPLTGGFIYTPDSNYNGGDTFVVTVADGNGGTTTSLVTIGVLPVNDAPVASNLNLTTPEDTPISSQISAADIDGDSLTFTVTGAPGNGSVSLNPITGSFIYSPDANYNGNDSFVVTISDGNGGTTISLVSIGVTPVNAAPTAGNLNLTTDEDVPVNGAISANDPDGDTLSYTVTGSPANGTVVLNPVMGTFTYTPNAGYGGSDSFVVSVSDGNGGVATSTVTIGINSLNDDPVVSDLNLTTAEDTAVNGAISATDPESDPLSYSVTGNPANGTVVLNPVTGTFVYTPASNYNGSDSFVVTISDGNGGTTTSNVMIVVTPNNDAPTATDLNLTTDENAPVNGAISANDLDSDALSYAVTGNPAQGTVVLNPATGTFTYTPNTGYNGSDSFVVTISDGNGGSTISNVTIGVSPVNDAPVAVNDAANVNEGSSVAVAVRANDSDPEGGSLEVVAVSQGSNGSVVIDAVTGNPIYTPNAGFSGNDSFTYTVQDLLGASATATVDVVVKANVPSVLLQDVGSGPEDNNVTGNVLTNDTDTDDTLTVASFQIAGLGSFSAGETALIAGVGSLVLNTNGSYVFDPVANWNGAVPQVTYTTNTGFSSTLDITVTPVNDAPIAVDDFYTINEDEAWSMPLPASGLVTNDSDPDGDSLRVVILENAVNGTLSVVSGNLVFTPTAEFSGTASFDYRVTDDKGGVDKGTVFINVVAVDDPTQANDDVKTVAEGNNATGNVLTNDIDPDSSLQVASFVINGTTYTANDGVTLPGVGQFTLLANGDYTFEPIDNNFNGAVPTVTYTTDTGASADLDVTLTPVNDAPVAVDDTFTITMNTTLSLPMPLAILLANDTDVDNDTLRVTVVDSAANGTLQVVSGNLVFTPTPGFTGVASFNYIVTDDKGGFDSGSVNINVVAPPNQAPETNALNVSGDEDTLITINLAGSDSDGLVAGYVIKSLPANGLLYSDAAMTTLIAVDDLVSGPVYFKPDANWNGASQFDYAARDDNGLDDSTPATVNISVTAVADAAVVGSGAGAVKEDTPAQSTAAGTLSITDPDAGEASFNAQTNSAGIYGSFSISSAGVWSYIIDNSLPAVQQLKEGESATEIFAVTSLDGTTTNVTITVNGTNDGPTATVDTASVGQDQVLTLTSAQLLGNDTDPDLDTLTIDTVQDAVNGSVSMIGGNVVFTPTPGYYGPASFTYTIIDVHGATSTATVAVDVARQNTSPVAVSDPAGVPYAINLGSSGTNSWSSLDSKSASVTRIAYNADGSEASFYVNGNHRGVAGTPRGPGMTTNEPNQIEYDIVTGTSESVVLTFNGNLTNASFSVASLYSDEDGGEVGQWTVYYQGVEVASNSFRLTSGHQGSFSINTGGLVFDSVKFSALHTFNGTGDGSGYFLTGFTGSGTAASNSPYLVAEDGTLDISTASAQHLLANDVDADGDSLVVTHINGLMISDGQVVTLASGALLTINTDGSFVYSPNGKFDLAPGQLATDTFSYDISDGHGGISSATATLTVVGVENVAPAPVNEIVGTPADDTLVGTLGADTFSWSLEDRGTPGDPTADTVTSFDGSEGDILDFRDLLQAESDATLNDFLHVTSDGIDTTINISSAGNYAGGYAADQTDQVILLQNVNLTGSDSADIIAQLKSSGQLLTD